MRRLPVYFVLDVSESMAGSLIQQLENGMEQIVRSLRTDPQALETVHLSVIVFAGKADTIVPLIDLVSFYPPRLPLGSGTALGDALNCLMDSIERDVVKTTTEQRGDWQPIVFLLTDGKPTDQTEQAVNRWQTNFVDKAQLIAITLGQNADTPLLQKLTDQVLQLDSTTTDQFGQFINWISKSVAATSQAVEQKVGKGVSLAKKPLGLTLVKDVPLQITNDIDESVVVLTGRCQKNKRPYLLKYNRIECNLFSKKSFELEGAFPIEESYFAWSVEGNAEQSIGTEKLNGVPPCPHCGNATAFAMCNCGKLLCTNGPGPFVCPWCSNESEFRGDGGNNDFDVTRGRG